MGKCKELQRNGKVNQVFCLGAVVTARVKENAPPPYESFHEKDPMAPQELSN